MDRHDLIRAPRRIDTPRLRLESPRPDHAPAFVESLNASLHTLGYIAWAQIARDLPWAIAFCQRASAFVESGDALIFYAFEIRSARYVGSVDLHTFDFEAPRCEIGYVGDARHAGRGLMREAALAVVSFGFGLGLARIQALSEASNTRALHFAQRALGFTREGVLRNFERDPKGRLGEQVMFAAYNPLSE